MNSVPAAAAHRQADPAGLASVCGALWLATLSLMTAFMHTTAPAHRYLLAARIARNLSLLRQQECFGEHARASFTRLARRWRDRADELSPTAPRSRGALARLQRLMAR